MRYPAQFQVDPGTHVKPVDIDPRSKASHVSHEQANAEIEH
jgi:hypothetical protein